MSKSNDFEASSTWLTSTPAAANLPNDTKLELYGLYKYIATSSGPSGPRPGVFSLSVRAKYDAWTRQAAQYAQLNDGTAQAQQRYVSIAKELGWTMEGMGVKGEEEEDIDLEHLSDDDDRDAPELRNKGRGRTGDGMGVRVSQMAVVEDQGGEAESSSGHPIHDAVIDERIDEVRRLLEDNPSLVNSRDSYANTPLHLASDRGHATVVRLLLQAGADRQLTDADGQTPLELAMLTGRHDIVLLLQ